MSPSASYVWKEITKRLDLFPLRISNALEQDLAEISKGARADTLKKHRYTDIADIYYYGEDCVDCGTHVSGKDMYMNHARETVCRTCYDKDWKPVREYRPELYNDNGKCCHCGQYGKHQSACSFCGAPIK